MNNRHPQYKETQLFDWDSEPATERESTFFHNDCIVAAEARREKRLAKGALRLVFGVVAAAGLAFAGFVQLVHFMVH